MKPSEWTFKIPDILKKATKEGRTTFSVEYSLDKLTGVEITLVVRKCKNGLTRMMDARGNNLDSIIRDFIYEERSKNL